MVIMPVTDEDSFNPRLLWIHLLDKRHNRISAYGFRATIKQVYFTAYFKKISSIVQIIYSHHSTSLKKTADISTIVCSPSNAGSAASAKAGQNHGGKTTGSFKTNRSNTSPR